MICRWYIVRVTICVIATNLEPILIDKLSEFVNKLKKEGHEEEIRQLMKKADDRNHNILVIDEMDMHRL